MSPLPQRGEQGGRGGAQMSREGKMVEDSGTAASPGSVSAFTTQEENKTRKKKRKFLCIGWPPWMKRKKKCVSTQHREGGEEKDQTGKSKKVEGGEESDAREYQLLDHLHKPPEDSTMGENSLDLRSSSVWQNLAKVGKVVGLGKTTPLNDFDSRREAESSLRNGSSIRKELLFDEKSLHRNKYLARANFPSSGASNDESSKGPRKRWRDRFPCCRKPRRSNKSTSSKSNKSTSSEELLLPQKGKPEGKHRPKRDTSKRSKPKRSKSKPKTKAPLRIKPLKANKNSLKGKSSGLDKPLLRNTPDKNKHNSEAMDPQRILTQTPSYYTDKKSDGDQIEDQEKNVGKKKGSWTYFGFSAIVCFCLAKLVMFSVIYVILDDDNGVFASIRVELMSTALLWFGVCCVLSFIKTRASIMTELFAAFIFVLLNLAIVLATLHYEHYIGDLKYFEGPWWLLSLIMSLLLVALSSCSVALAKLHYS